MKRGGLFIGLFLLALSVVYLQPVFFPQSPSKPRQSVTTSVDGIPTTMNYEPIKAQGYATSIGMTVKAFNQQFGAPIKSYPSGYGETVSLYPALEEEYLEVNSKNGKITMVKTTGTAAKNLEPFAMGMTMSELSQLTMIYPNFLLEYQKESISLELMEEDMNYRPLIAFDNGSFAVLFFDQANSKLFAAAFVDEETLLKLAPYQVVDGNLPSFVEEADDWAPIDHAKSENSFVLLNLLRGMDQLPEYQSDFDLQQSSEKLLKDFLETPQEFLNEERLAIFEDVKEKRNLQPFFLSSEEWGKILQEHKIEKAQGVMEFPVYDPTFQLLTYYSDPYLHTKFFRDDSEGIAVAISKENMVVLLQERETKVEESEEQ
ncbi:CAP-associated domain-containing protein [Enterococcus massiliensis]|uniref:CAP-associated domain-containing protein n=1 Tax=Enterococcus massiliensis TaxID=1640685 RepID=UPI00065DCAC5|nr:CAP-associated domain-containing protein [Enterococcus massiliensis]